jgi:hypothetical protein
MKTAVEWLYETLWEQNNYSLPSNILEQAKEMEKEQMINFLIEVMKKGLEYENEEEWDDEYLPLIKERAEQYYNENFKQQEQ